GLRGLKIGDRASSAAGVANGASRQEADAHRPHRSAGAGAGGISEPGLRRQSTWLEASGGDSLVTRQARGPKVVTRRGPSPYYSNEDRERLARDRKEKRDFARGHTKVDQSHVPSADLEKLPPLEEIYSREYSGDADADPIGGRKRYLYLVMFKQPAMTTAVAMKQVIAGYWYFLSKQMSCKDIQIRPRKAENGNTVTELEYEMKEYGEIPRETGKKEKYGKAVMMEFKFKAPVSATQYIQKKLYNDNNVLRFMALSLTRSFAHVGEDNELLL
ncbi:unnamed protein product, partial [Effrenium voratum]